MSGRRANAHSPRRDWIRWGYVETTPEQKGSLTRTPGVHTTHSGAEFVARERERRPRFWEGAAGSSCYAEPNVLAIRAGLKPLGFLFFSSLYAARFWSLVLGAFSFAHFSSRQTLAGVSSEAASRFAWEDCFASAFTWVFARLARSATFFLAFPISSEREGQGAGAGRAGR